MRSRPVSICGKSRPPIRRSDQPVADISGFSRSQKKGRLGVLFCCLSQADAVAGIRLRHGFFRPVGLRENPGDASSCVSERLVREKAWQRLKYTRTRAVLNKIGGAQMSILITTRCCTRHSGKAQPTAGPESNDTAGETRTRIEKNARAHRMRPASRHIDEHTRRLYSEQTVCSTNKRVE
jgi:hypothetical protein